MIGLVLVEVAPSGVAPSGAALLGEVLSGPDPVDVVSVGVDSVDVDEVVGAVLAPLAVDMAVESVGASAAADAGVWPAGLPAGLTDMPPHAERDIAAAATTVMMGVRRVMVSPAALLHVVEASLCTGTAEVSRARLDRRALVPRQRLTDRRLRVGRPQRVDQRLRHTPGVQPRTARDPAPST
ncbi:hypothetical protein GCM10025862_06180 [Arsenicicoccus piscis]|uniref:Uncharacterized protein n=1 Tax=Arsenicicoccus piscis TaxID=673954 RepID=A0ABQ6HJQ3_9MICO|nr:hypothetical protein GCM10025862_06180 [Arsenicicoccus piscis]